MGPNSVVLKLGPNSSLQNRLVRWGLPPLYQLFSRILSIRCGTWVFPNTPSRPTLFGLGAWIGRWPLNSTSSDTMLKLGPNSSLQNRLVRWGLPPLYKLFSRVLSIRCGTWVFPNSWVLTPARAHPEKSPPCNFHRSIPILLSYTTNPYFGDILINLNILTTAFQWSTRGKFKYWFATPTTKKCLTWGYS